MYTKEELDSRIVLAISRRDSFLKEMLELQSKMDTSRAELGMYVRYREAMYNVPEAVYSGGEGLADSQGNAVQQRS